MRLCAQGRWGAFLEVLLQLQVCWVGMLATGWSCRTGEGPAFPSTDPSCCAKHVSRNLSTSLVFVAWRKWVFKNSRLKCHLFLVAASRCLSPVGYEDTERMKRLAVLSPYFLKPLFVWKETVQGSASPLISFARPSRRLVQRHGTELKKHQKLGTEPARCAVSISLV